MLPQKVTAGAAELTGEADALEAATANFSSAVSGTAAEVQGFADETTNVVAEGTEKLQGEMAEVEGEDSYLKMNRINLN